MKGCIVSRFPNVAAVRPLVCSALCALVALTFAGCGAGQSSGLPVDHSRNAASVTPSITIGGCSAGETCPPPGGGATPIPSPNPYTNIYTLPASSPMHVTIKNAMVPSTGDPISLVVSQPNGYADATVQAVDQTTGQVLLTSTVSAQGAAKFFGCSSPANCAFQWIRDWIISQGIDWLWNNRGSLMCATTIPSYGSCPGDITQWIPAQDPPTGYYWIPTTFNNNPGYGWQPYTSSDPNDPNNPDGRPWRQQCYMSPDGSVNCGPPASGSPGGGGSPVTPGP